MSSPSEIASRVRPLKDKIRLSIKKAVQDQEKELVNFITMNQLYEKGEDGKGKKLKPNYDSKYKSRRTKQGVSNQGLRLRNDHVTLVFKGDLYEGMKVKVNFSSFEVDSIVDHAKYMKGKYGEDIFLINSENLRIFTNKYILPEINLNV